jgi:D-tyrosyl-tRNA(Tyr) deacylase
LISSNKDHAMRVIIQRVSNAQVSVAEQTIASIGPGLLLLVGFTAGDEAADLAWMAGKVARLRLFADADGVMNRSVQDVAGAVLAVSQFTLFASTKKGNRPSWSQAAPPAVAEPLFAQFVGQLESTLGQPVPCGQFGADMRVSLVNDGPVTLLLDSKAPE